MNILVGCEESQVVCMAFRLKGHNAFSCDLQKCSGGYPQFHFFDSIWDIINGGNLKTEDGNAVYIENWDMIIGHPPCTYLSNAGNDYFNLTKYKDAYVRWFERYDAIDFFCKMFTKKIPKICLENPVGFINGIWPPTQVIEPYYFGDSDKKRTCLWLKGLPKLIHVSQDDIFSKKTHVSVQPKYTFISKNGKAKKYLFYGFHFRWYKKCTKIKIKNLSRYCRCYGKSMGVKCTPPHCPILHSSSPSTHLISLIQG